MENLKRYNRLTEYLKNKFGERTLKICIDGGFTCPNRDGTAGIGGCIFCSEHGSGDHLNSSKNIQAQIESYFSSYRSTRANKFIAYFQNFTNTYDTIANLKLKYDSALIDDRIVAGETNDDLHNTVKFINNHNIQGLKIHSTYVIQNTKLAQMYYDGKYTPLELDNYLNSVVYILTHISPNIVIHRISGDAPKDLLIAPEWNAHKKLVLNGVDRILKEKDLYQGKEI